MVIALLIIAVGAAWLAAAGFARLRAPFDRLHCGAFAGVAAGLPLLAASVLADGISVRAGKILLVVLVNLLSGAAIAPVIGRAIRVRP